jgi:hypothetical protein
MHDAAVAKLVAIPLGVAVAVYLPRLLARRQRGRVTELVRDGRAEWAAFGWVIEGAEPHFGPDDRHRPDGILSIKGTTLTWRSLGTIHRDGQVHRPLAELPVVSSERKGRKRVLLLGNGDRPLLLVHLHTEAGTPPPAWLPERPRS